MPVRMSSVRIRGTAKAESVTYPGIWLCFIPKTYLLLWLTILTGSRFRFLTDDPANRELAKTAILMPNRMPCTAIIQPDTFSKPETSLCPAILDQSLSDCFWGVKMESPKRKKQLLLLPERRISGHRRVRQDVKISVRNEIPDAVRAYANSFGRQIKEFRSIHPGSKTKISRIEEKNSSRKTSKNLYSCPKRHKAWRNLQIPVRRRKTETERMLEIKFINFPANSRSSN